MGGPALSGWARCSTPAASHPLHHTRCGTPAAAHPRWSLAAALAAVVAGRFHRSVRIDERRATHRSSTLVAAVDPTPPLPPRHLRRCGTRQTARSGCWSVTTKSAWATTSWLGAGAPRPSAAISSTSNMARTATRCPRIAHAGAPTSTHAWRHAHLAVAAPCDRRSAPCSSLLGSLRAACPLTRPVCDPLRVQPLYPHMKRPMESRIISPGPGCLDGEEMAHLRGLPGPQSWARSSLLAGRWNSGASARSSMVLEDASGPDSVPFYPVEGS